MNAQLRSALQWRSEWSTPTYRSSMWCPNAGLVHNDGLPVTKCGFTGGHVCVCNDSHQVDLSASAPSPSSEGEIPPPASTDPGLQHTRVPDQWSTAWIYGSIAFRLHMIVRILVVAIGVRATASLRQAVVHLHSLCDSPRFFVQVLQRLIARHEQRLTTDLWRPNAVQHRQRPRLLVPRVVDVPFKPTTVIERPGVLVMGTGSRSSQRRHR